jgi:hypothetical protein
MAPRAAPELVLQRASAGLKKRFRGRAHREVSRIAQGDPENEGAVMKRVVTLIALIAALGAVSVPTATADGGLNLCVGCTSPQPAASTSVGICADAVPCPQYFWYLGYYYYGPQTWYTQDAYKNYYQVRTYYAYSSGWHRADCYFLMSSNNMFRGCWWLS